MLDFYRNDQVDSLYRIRDKLIIAAKVAAILSEWVQNAPDGTNTIILKKNDIGTDSTDDDTVKTIQEVKCGMYFRKKEGKIVFLAFNPHTDACNIFQIFINEIGLEEDWTVDYR